MRHTQKRESSRRSRDEVVVLGSHQHLGYRHAEYGGKPAAKRVLKPQDRTPLDADLVVAHDNEDLANAGWRIAWIFPVLLVLCTAGAIVAAIAQSLAG